MINHIIIQIIKLKFFFSNNSKLYLDMAMRFWEEQTPDTQLRGSLPWNICQMTHCSSFVASSLKLSLMSYWKKEKQRTHGPMLTHTVACFFRYSYTLLVQFCGYMYLIAQIWCDSISEGHCFAFLIGKYEKKAFNFMILNFILFFERLSFISHKRRKSSFSPSWRNW